MRTIANHRRLLPALLVAAVIPLGAPSLAHAASHRPPTGPPRANGPAGLVVTARSAATLPERQDVDAPAVGTV